MKPRFWDGFWIGFNVAASLLNFSEGHFGWAAFQATCALVLAIVAHYERKLERVRAS